MTGGNGQGKLSTDTFFYYRGSDLELNSIYDQHVESLVRTLALRDIETEVHTRRVSSAAQDLACIWGIPTDEIIHIRRGALLHDIGKIGVPDCILHKKDPLTDKERDLISQHPVIAYNLLFPVPYLRPALDIPLYHHEKWDGSGYPYRLKGNQIPVAARLFAIVDTWDALLSDRPYRPAWPVERTRDYIISQSGQSFEPDIVIAFLAGLDSQKSISFCPVETKSSYHTYTSRTDLYSNS